MKRLFFSGIIFALSITLAGQSPVKPESIINAGTTTGTAGIVTVTQSASIDTLMGRYISLNKSLDGMEGVRIQIFRGSGRNAREEANQAKAKFISEFPGIEAYVRFDPPNYFKVRVGDFRTRHEATALFYKVSRQFPQSYIVKDIINFPDLNK